MELDNNRWLLVISMTNWCHQSIVQLYMYDKVNHTTLVQRKYHLFRKCWWSPCNTYITDANRSNPLYMILIWRYLTSWISSEIHWNNGFILISVSGGERYDSGVNNDMGEFEIKTFGELSPSSGSWGFATSFLKDKEEIRKRLHCLGQF